MHTGPVSTVLPSGSPARAGDAGTGRHARRTGATDPPGTARTPPARGRDPPRAGSAGWPAAVRVPLQVLGQTLAKAWQDRILGLSAEAAFWQILSVPPLLIGLLGSLGYLGAVIGEASVREIEERLLDARRPRC